MLKEPDETGRAQRNGIENTIYVEYMLNYIVRAGDGHMIS